MTLRPIFRFIRALLLTALFLAALLMVAAGIVSVTAKGPQDVPWAPFDMADPPGRFTITKLVNLRSDRDECGEKLKLAGFEPEFQPTRGDGNCRATDLLALGERGRGELSLRPAGVTPSCPVVAGMILWKWHVVDPAARRILGSKVQTIQHFGSYSCRRIGGGTSGSWSEHATGNAIDIAAIELADGQRVSVLSDWTDAGPKGQFLREIRDGACRTFATVLSPDYNAAHADHLHFDQASRGMTGFGYCR